jgi:fructose-1,6-bisphosphatase/inositol monophosphatase family enzyme
MKIAIFAFLMVVVLTLVEGQWFYGGDGGGRAKKDTENRMRLKRHLDNKLLEQDFINLQRRYIRDVNKKQHVQK